MLNFNTQKNLCIINLNAYLRFLNQYVPLYFDLFIESI